MPPAIYLIAFERDKEEELQEASAAKKIQKRYEKQIDAEKKECYKIGYREMNTCIQKISKQLLVLVLKNKHYGSITEDKIVISLLNWRK